MNVSSRHVSYLYQVSYFSSRARHVFDTAAVYVCTKTVTNIVFNSNTAFVSVHLSLLWLPSIYSSYTYVLGSWCCHVNNKAQVVHRIENRILFYIKLHFG